MWIITWCQMDHVGPLDYFQKPPLGGRLAQKWETKALMESHNCRLIIYCHMWGPHMDKNSLN